MSTPHINTLREHLMGTLADLRNKDNPMEPDRARAIAQVSSVLVDTARVEIDYLRATNQDRSDFMERDEVPARPAIQGAHNPFGVASIVHRLED